MREWIRRVLAPRSSDEVEAHREHLLYIAVVVVGGLSTLNIATGTVVFVLGSLDSASVVAILGAATLLSCVLSYWMGRRGWVTLAGYVPALTVWAGTTGLLGLGGWSTIAVVGYVLCAVLATLLSGWPGGLILGALSMLSYWGIGQLYALGRTPEWFSLPRPVGWLAPNLFLLGTTLASICLLVYLSSRQLGVLATQKLVEAQRDAKELEKAARERDELIGRLEQTVERQEQLLATLNEISAPVLPLFEGLVVMPLVGRVDLQRAERLLDDILDGVVAYGADHVLLDVTGMPDIDIDSAQILIEAIEGARLLGSQCVLVGVQPDVASELVALEVDLSEITSYATLREGLVEILGSRALHEMPA